MPLFSIIVPVYNVEAYIDECLESILCQTFKDYEIILVDDGSSDSSKTIVDTYSKKYNFIKAIHQENQGLSHTRNVGVKSSRGSYLLFLDSDDKLADKDVLLKLSQGLDGFEVVFLGFEKWFRDNTRSIISKDLILRGTNIDEIIYNMVIRGEYVTSACNKCIKKDFFVANKLFFKEGILSEDVEWSIRLLLNLKSLKSLEGSYYLYRQTREGSISTTFVPKHAYDLYDSLLLCLSYLEDTSDLKRKALLNFIAFQYVILMAYYQEVKDANLKRQIKEMAYLLKYNKIKKVRVIYYLYKFLGYNFASKIMNKYVRNRK